ncbi:PKD domain-containing protein [Ferruginibacter sp.]|nr:PKD domain-containing protein [Ferruginibacter sp.]
MRKFYQNNRLISQPIYRFFIFFLLAGAGSFSAFAQCPPNIDFEMGDFTGWQCYIQNGYSGGTPNPTLSVPIPGRHDMLFTPPGNGSDPYGNFPQNCPNGSGHSIRIGHITTGGQMVDKVSYTFTIPANQNTFNLIYNYALVLNDGGGNHNVTNQPRFIIETKNITDGSALPCQLAEINVATNLPGFFQSPTNAPNGSIVKCRNWAAGSLNLDGYAGKTIEIAFTVTGCGLGGGTHFGYAYLDVNTECSSAFTGATFCPDDTTITVVAPSGYAGYQWWNGDHTISYPQGNQQSLTLNPPPLAGDSLTVDLEPFNGYGCSAQLKAYLFDTLTVQSNAGVDRETCDNNPVQLGGPPIPGRVYKWTPVTGLSDPNISNPIATPSVSTTYTLTVTNSGGGCATPDVVNVDVDILSDSIELIGPASHCTVTGETVVLKVLPHDNIQWYRNTSPIPGATQTSLTVTQSGAYYAYVSSSSGCNRTTAIKQIDIWETPVAGFSTNNATQCNAGNQFVFTNTSTLATGTLQYAWDLGDGTLASTMDVTHTYPKEGNYTVKLLVTAPGGCMDSSRFDVVVNPSPASAFTIDAAEQCFKNNWFVFNTTSTVSTGILTYIWDFGDGNVDYSNDIAHKYAQAGTYIVKLTAKETIGGCTDDSSFTVIAHQSPVANFVINNTPQCFPGHQFVLTNGTSILSDTLLYTWDMGDGVIKTDKAPVYSYAKAGNYTIKLLVGSLFGCQDSIAANVVVHPVPLADFTIKPICVNLQVPIINRTFNNTTSTVNYLWDFGNGHTDNIKSPVYSYPTAGTYSVSLSVSTAQCPVSFDTKTIKVAIEDQLPGIVYPDVDAAFNYPEQLQARPIGNGVIWTPPTNLSNRFSFTPTFKGLTPQLYTVQIKTATGCITVDTQLVKTHKNIKIYVPTGFTPDGNTINERLRPVLIGFTKVNYFRIYNRWGQLLFSMKSDMPGWDGRINGALAETQTVVWMIEAVDVDGKVHNQQGTTVLYR